MRNPRSAMSDEWRAANPAKPIPKPEPPSAEELARRQQVADHYKRVENGPMRTAAYPHVSPDSGGDVVTYQADVPYTALVIREDAAQPLYPFPPKQLAAFCEARGIRFTRCRWDVNERKLNPIGGHRIHILLFETVEDQRIVASAFPGKLF